MSQQLIDRLQETMDLIKTTQLASDGWSHSDALAKAAIEANGVLITTTLSSANAIKKRHPGLEAFSMFNVQQLRGRNIKAIFFDNDVIENICHSHVLKIKSVKQFLSDL